MPILDIGHVATKIGSLPVGICCGILSDLNMLYLFFRLPFGKKICGETSIFLLRPHRSKFYVMIQFLRTLLWYSEIA